MRWYKAEKYFRFFHWINFRNSANPSWLSNSICSFRWRLTILMMKVQHFFYNDEFFWGIVYKSGSYNCTNTNIITRRRYFRELFSSTRLLDAPGHHSYTIVMIDECLLYENNCDFSLALCNDCLTITYTSNDGVYRCNCVYQRMPGITPNNKHEIKYALKRWMCNIVGWTIYQTSKFAVHVS